MKDEQEIGIIGAGLAGLSLAIQLARDGHSVVLFEKQSFPFHKLCGEYLSRESIPFLASLGIRFDELQPASIDRLKISHPNGNSIDAILPLGGIGISRWLLDQKLFEIAQKEGVKVYENTTVKHVAKNDDGFIIHSSNGKAQCDLIISCFGKKSNLKSNVGFRNANKGNQYIGVKYHVKYGEHPKDLISMHTFDNGYLGVCRLEKDWVSVCYLSHTDNLKKAANKLKQMESQILSQNPHIRDILEKASFINSKPITVSNISFRKKSLIHDDVIYAGDAAGMITPLCGNGMSMALHSSYLLGDLLKSYLNKEIDRETLYSSYQNQWKQTFSRRMATGRVIQNLFRKERNASWMMKLLKTFPMLNRQMIKLTHGEPFYKPEATDHLQIS